MSLLIALSGALALATSPQTSDLKPADLADLQCLALAAYSVMAAEPGSVEQAGVTSGVTYYLGRLQGRTPGINWLQRLRGFSDTLKLEDLQAFAPRCGAELTEMGRAMSAMGDEPAA